MGARDLRAGTMMFAVFEGNDDHPFAVAFKPEPEESPALAEDARVYVPAYFGPSGWLALERMLRALDEA